MKASDDLFVCVMRVSHLILGNGGFGGDKGGFGGDKGKFGGKEGGFGT